MRKLYIAFQYLLCLGWALLSFQLVPGANVLTYIGFIILWSLIGFVVVEVGVRFLQKLKKPKFSDKFDREFKEEMREALEQ